MRRGVSAIAKFAKNWRNFVESGSPPLKMLNYVKCNLVKMEGRKILFVIDVLGFLVK
jgi:hypothetical protein